MLKELFITQTGNSGPSLRIIAGVLLAISVVILPLIGQIEVGKELQNQQNEIIKALEQILAGIAMIIVVADKVRSVWKGKSK